MCCKVHQHNTFSCSNLEYWANVSTCYAIRLFISMETHCMYLSYSCFHSSGNVDWGPVPLNEVSLSSEIPRSPQIVFRGYWQLGKCVSYLVNCFPWPKSELIVSKAKMFQVIMWVCGKLKQCTTYCNLLLIVFLALNIESFLDSHLWREWK